MSTGTTACPTPSATRRTENRGLAWVLGAFLICPCHLPVTLAVFATLLSGTAIGALISGHPYIAGAVLTLAWISATWRGIRHVRSARTVAAADGASARSSES
jgi:cytochrome c biogenesis protein CcdA